MTAKSKFILVATAAIFTMGCAANATPQQIADNTVDVKKTKKIRKIRFNQDASYDWDDIDSNDDGKVSKAEWQQHRKAQNYDDDEGENFFKKFDTNKDGFVEKVEMDEEVERIVERALANIDIEGIEKRAAHAAQRATRIAERSMRWQLRGLENFNLEHDFDFDFGDVGNFSFHEDGDGFVERWDKNKDGSVSSDEYITKRIETYSSKTKEAFKAMDGNKDGKVSEEEVDAYHKAQRETMHENRQAMRKKMRGERDKMKEEMRVERDKMKEEMRKVRADSKKRREEIKKRQEERKQELENNPKL